MAEHLIDKRGRVFTQNVDPSGLHYLTREHASGAVDICCRGTARAVKRYVERKKLEKFNPLIQTRKKQTS